LPERDREVLALACWEGLTSEQIAEVEGCSAIAARTRLHRARKRLAATLETPRLQEMRYPVNELSYVDRDGRQTSHLTMPPGFTQVVSLLRGDLARAVADDTRAEIRYGTSVAGIRHDGDTVTVRLTDGTHRVVDLLAGADGARSRVRELAFGGERHVRYLGHHVAACVIADERLSQRVGMRYQMLTVPGLMAGAYALRDGRLALLFLRREADPRLGPRRRAGSAGRHPARSSLSLRTADAAHDR
jgi:2-polyprenyl-6-methoxyphenol hydroxylase-like FAD-dependent oxidoreductase